MDKTGFAFGFFRKLTDWLKNVLRVFIGPFFNKRRPPELQELEEQFTKASKLDSEKLRDRQVSTTIRSGRG